MKLGIALPEQLERKFSPAIMKNFPDITIIIIPYPSIFEIPSLLSGKQKKLDVLLFLGKTAMEYTKAKITPVIPWEFVSRTHATILHYLLLLTLKGHTIYDITTDFQDKKLLYDTYKELNLDVADIHISFVPPYTFDETFITKTVQYHYNQYRFNKNQTCLTIFYDVYKRLYLSNIPVVYLSPTIYDICNDIRKAQADFLLQISRESQLIIIDVVIDERDNYSPLNTNEYQLTFENINVMKQVYLFAKKIQASVISVTETEFLLFSTRAIVENQTDKFHKFSLFDDIQKHTVSTVSVGIGFGKTAMEAKYHARLGVKRAISGGGNQLFLVYDLETIRGPIGNEKEYDLNISNSFLSISQQTGVSSVTLCKLHNMIVAQGKNEFTTAEIADALHVTPRTIDRIVLKLMQFDYCFESGKKYQQKNGRPSRILKFKI